MSRYLLLSALLSLGPAGFASALPARSAGAGEGLQMPAGASPAPETHLHLAAGENPAPGQTLQVPAGESAAPDWSAADVRALSAPKGLERDPAALASYLTRGVPDDADRARSIFRWIAENIAYDYEQMGTNTPMAPESVLERGRSVCEGYSSVFELLGRLAGLEVVTIHGYAKGYGYAAGRHFDRPNHAWNAVRIDGRWRLIDSTWGAGYVRDGQFVKQFDDFFFLPSPEALAFTHLPEDPRWALVAAPLSLREFEAQPRVEPAFFRAGFSAADARAAAGVSSALVQVFLAPGQPIAVRTAPPQGTLAVRRSYRFELRAPRGTTLAVVNGGRWQYLRRVDGGYATMVIPRGGNVYVAARTGPGSRFQTLLLYQAR